jgi:hypothetical protein
MRPVQYLHTSIGSTLAALTLVSCTEIGAMRLGQQQEEFDPTTTIDVNTKLDMLWIVDNSPSMGPVQKRIRDGFASFSARYMKPTWDIRVAVINQDTYLAHPSFAGHLNSVSNGRYSRPTGFQSTYLNPGSTANPRRQTPFVTPAWWTGTAISSNGTVTGSGVKMRHGVPEYNGANPSQDVGPSNPSLWARLIPGRHDGPMATICWTAPNNPAFFGVSQCHVRDQQNQWSGTDDCVRGGPGNLDSSIQCTNTIMNNTVRSGKPIISTIPPVGTAPDQAWIDGLNRDFLVNLSGGTAGIGVEKLFNSIQQLITDNESTSTAFFRPGALRVIVIVSDEDDQSMIFPSSQINPESFGYNSGSGCPWKTVDGHTYRLQVCPQAGTILPVATFKSQLDEFFRTVDGHPGVGDPNYFAVTITPKTGGAIQSIHDDLGEDANGYDTCSADIATRMFDFVDSVGNGSLKLELTSSDYAPLLDAIGQTVVQKKATFKLSRAPTSQEQMIVKIRHQDGSETLIPSSDYVVAGLFVTITNQNIVLSLSATDKLIINYQPGTLF